MTAYVHSISVGVRHDNFVTVIIAASTYSANINNFMYYDGHYMFLHYTYDGCKLDSIFEIYLSLQGHRDAQRNSKSNSELNRECLDAASSLDR